jgi:hypothetical protein
MNLPDSFYIALCMTILLVGAVYWVWTQIQYVQRKVNVLENIVYELKTLCSKEEPTYAPPPSDLELHETLQKEIAPYATVEELDAPMPSPASRPVSRPASPVFQMEEPVFAALTAQTAQAAHAAQAMPEVREVPEVPEVPEFVEPEQEPIFNMDRFVREVDVEAEDLQPGGVGSGVVAPPIQSSLDTMTIKELRRLAQQKGISGANDMKKKEIIEAIRAVPIESFLE